MVEVLELVKQYSGATTPAVDGVTFSVDQGEVFSLLGPNGAGKTTTLSETAGTVHPFRCAGAA
jgi:ABC-2 type transport system ATP-binding protein